MELVNRYVYAVTQKLPEQQRADIEKELKGLIEDMLEERTEGGPVLESDVEEVLHELGDPSALADKYRGKDRYLIGPERFDAYVSVVKIVLVSVFIGITVASVIEFVMNPVRVVNHFAEYMATLFSVCIQGFAWVTMIFAILEYMGMRDSNNKLTSKKQWNLSDLPLLPDSKTMIKPSEPIIGIIVSVLALILFTFALDLVGVHRYNEGLSWVIPVFNGEVFSKYVPFIWLITAISILRDCLKMVKRKWTNEIVILHLVFNIISLVLMFAMFTNPSIWNPGFINELVHAGIITEGSEAYNTVATIWDSFTGGLIYIIVLITFIDSVAVSLKLFRRK